MFLLPTYIAIPKIIENRFLLHPYMNRSKRKSEKKTTRRNQIMVSRLQAAQGAHAAASASLARARLCRCPRWPGRPRHHFLAPVWPGKAWSAQGSRSTREPRHMGEGCKRASERNDRRPGNTEKLRERPAAVPVHMSWTCMTVIHQIEET